MSANTYVFIGPTISKEEAQSCLNAIYLPPISQGDIVSLLRKKPQIIGIIDGYFEYVPSVWHKEILLALSKGIQVVGGASMGALRAAELYPFGMIGVGQVFEWYRDGIIEADDEVAVRHAPATYGYKSAGEALVNMRGTLQAAVTASIITIPVMTQLIAFAQKINYIDRSYSYLLNYALRHGVAEEDILQLKTYLKNHQVNQKKADAIQLLKYIAGLQHKLTPPNNTTFNLQYTSVLASLVDKDASLATVDGIRLTADKLMNHTRIEHEKFPELKERAKWNTYLLQLVKAENITHSMPAYEILLARFQDAFELETIQDLNLWQQNNHLEDEEFIDFVKVWAFIEIIKERKPSFIRNIPSSPNVKLKNCDLLRQLRLENIYKAMIDSLVAKENFLQEVQYREDMISEKKLHAFYFKQKKMAIPSHIEPYINDLGFSDKEIFNIELVKYYRYHQHQRNTFLNLFRNVSS